MKSNRIAILSLLALALLVSVPSTFAQSQVKANVPFAFRVGNMALPSGSYEVISMSSDAILISNRGGHAAALTLVRNEYGTKDQSPKLVFHKCGNDYFLAEIWTGSGSHSMQLPKSKLEKELQASNHGAIAEDEIIVALN